MVQLEPLTNLRAHGIEEPWVIMTSIVGTKGFQIILGDGFATGVAFTNSDFLGQHVFERVDVDALVPIARAFWLLFGVQRPHNRALGADRWPSAR